MGRSDRGQEQNLNFPQQPPPVLPHLFLRRLQASSVGSRHDRNKLRNVDTSEELRNGKHPVLSSSGLQRFRLYLVTISMAAKHKPAGAWRQTPVLFSPSTPGGPTGPVFVNCGD